VIAAAPVVTKVGYYRVIRVSFVLKIFTGLSLFVIGRNHPWIVAAFFVIERYVVAIPLFSPSPRLCFSLVLFVGLSVISASSNVLDECRMG